ncbi:MAG: hypothetical protein DSZ06_04670 [Sulfurospirillum sp.]|nr:MAG: hypothetical protein DSZ06_04670 [Sulfurospirillum sp.]
MKKIFSLVAISLLVGCGSINDSSNKFDDYKYNKNAPSEQWSLKDLTPPKFSLTTNNHINDFSSIIYPNHPRIYFRDSDVAYLRSKMSSGAWKTIEDTITNPKLFPPNISYEEAKNRLEKYFEDTDYPRLLAFYAFMTQDPKYKELVTKWAVDELSKEDSALNDLVRPKIARLAEIYDWFYDDLSSSQKETIRAALKRNIEIFLSLDQAKDPNFIQSHSRWGHGVVADALLAMYGDFDLFFTKSYADSKLRQIRELFRNYEKTEKFIASDGGWHLGWMYGYYYGDYTFNYMVWSSATSETMLEDWMGDLSYWYIYGLRANHTFGNMGDYAVNDNGMNLGEYAVLYQARYKNDPYTKLYLSQLRDTDFNFENHNYFIRFLLSDKNTQDQSKNINFNDLPHSRYFKQTGVVIARDGWDYNSTMLTFKSSPFYSAGHHHRDENSFTIDYKTTLAVDSGFYDATDTPHYKNYYTRTIAHNAITVYNPNQQYYYFVHYNKEIPKEQKKIPNDGGQIYKEHDPIDFKEVEKFGKLDGVTKYLFKPDSYTYMQADATKAYDSNSVSLEKRDILFLQDKRYKHPVTIVYDRVESTDPSFQKRYLLHTQSDQKPLIDGDKFISISKVYQKNDDESYSYKESVKLTNFTLYPQNATLKVLGNIDRYSKEAYPYYDGMDVNTTPTNTGIVKASKKNPQDKTGNWRLELEVPTGKSYDQILNVICVNDKDQTPLEAKLISGNETIGTKVGDSIVLFPKSRAESDHLNFSYNDENGSFHIIAVTSFKKGETASIKQNGLPAKRVQVQKDGIVDFYLDLNSSDNIEILK